MLLKQRVEGLVLHWCPYAEPLVLQVIQWLVLVLWFKLGLVFSPGFLVSVAGFANPGDGSLGPTCVLMKFCSAHS